MSACAVAVIVGCSSDDEPVSGTESTTATAPTTAEVSTTAPTDASDGDASQTETTDVAETETTFAEPVKVDPARDAGPVDAPAGVQPSGFTTATVRVTAADGTTCDVCVWLADVADERNRGLMGVTDLGEPVGMLFRFEQPTSGNFFMFGTPMPLSIAWFGVDGAHVGQTDMTPCLVDDSSTCERYGPGAEYVSAIEMVDGELDVIGIGPGSTIEILAEHEECPAA